MMKNAFLKQVATLLSGTMLAQLIGVMFQLLTRRLYTVEQFGAYAVVMSVVSVIIVVSALRYNTIGTLPKNDTETKQLGVLAIFISVCVSIILGVFVYLFGDYFAIWLDLDLKWKSYLYAIPFFVLLLNTYEVFDTYLLRHGKYNSIAINKGLRRSAEGVGQSALSNAFQNYGLLLGDLLGQLMNMLTALVQLRRTNFFEISISWSLVKFVFFRYAHFPKMNLLPSLVNAISKVFPVLLINRFFSETETGYFSLTHMVLALPVALLGDAMSKVTLRNLSEKKNAGKPVYSEIWRNLGIAVTLSVLGIVTIWIVGVDLLTLIFGKQGEIAGQYALIMAFSYAIKLIYVVVMKLFIALERLKALSIFQMVYFFTMVFVGALQYETVNELLIVFVVVDVILYSVIILRAIVLAKSYDNVINSNQCNINGV